MAILAYTADSSGEMLGVELSNENVLSAIVGILHSRDYGVEGVRNLLVDNDFKSVRQFVHVLATLVVGGTVVLAGDFWRESVHTVDIVTGRPEDLLEPRLLTLGPAARAGSEVGAVDRLQRVADHGRTGIQAADSVPGRSACDRVG